MSDQIPDPILILGIDPSATATGLVLATYEHFKQPEIIYADTFISHETSAQRKSVICEVPRLAYYDLIRAKLMEIYGNYPEIDLIAIERGFIGKDRQQATGLEVVRVGGFLEGMCTTLWPDVKIARIYPNDWRDMVHGDHYGTTEQWKERSLQWGQAVSDKITDHHQADALGVLAACGELYCTEGHVASR